ncbi:MAG TPA: hypothetical protein VKT19_06820 [Steroidobacteraceae bacterium]|nr:hypothetical protein [Steroidobacteraceae bacterium]
MNESAPELQTPPAQPPLPHPSDERVLKSLRAVLTADERLEAWAIQCWWHALTHRRMVLGATSGRLLAVTRPLFGGFDLTDIRWQDLREVHIHVGMLSARLTVSAFTSQDLASAEGQVRTLSYDGLRKHEAQALYRICQANDQAWREKRRIRELEELRARSGGIQIGTAAAAPAAAAGPAASAPGAAIGEDAASRLRSARSMLDAGLISDSEFEAIKARIINSV